MALPRICEVEQTSAGIEQKNAQLMSYLHNMLIEQPNHQNQFSVEKSYIQKSFWPKCAM
jgi:hypothetical protein